MSAEMTERSFEEILLSIEKLVDQILTRLDKTDGKMDSLGHQLRWKERSGW